MFVGRNKEADRSARGGMAGVLTTPERISGPWRDLFVAAYAARLDGEFYGYCKIYSMQPDDAWEPGALAKVTTQNAYPDASSALRAIEVRTHEVVEAMHDVLKSIAAFRASCR